MRKGLCVLTAGLVVLAAWQFSGCVSVLPQFTVPISLGGNGVFDVQAGEPKTVQIARDNFDTGGITLGSGSMQIAPEAITVTPAGGAAGKGTANWQAGGTLVITGWIGPIDDVDTVCDTGEQYGPYTVELDENYVPVSVVPSSITLSQTTLDLLNGGAFSLCIEVVSPVTGTVTIDTLTFRVGL